MIAILISTVWVIFVVHLIRPYDTTGCCTTIFIPTAMAFSVVSQTTRWAYHPVMVRRTSSLYQNNKYRNFPRSKVTTTLQSSRSSRENVDTKHSTHSSDHYYYNYHKNNSSLLSIVQNYDITRRSTTFYQPNDSSNRNISDTISTTISSSTGTTLTNDMVHPVTNALFVPITNIIQKWMNATELLSQLFPQHQQLRQRQYPRLPPFFVEDWNVLYYDLILIINLVVSISFWVVHRMDISYIGIAFNEGCLLSLLWIIAGLFHGSFLYTAVDGHQSPPPPIRSNTPTSNMRITILNTNDIQKGNATTEMSDNRQQNDNNSSSGGPMAAGLLAFHTYLNTMNLRLLYALIVAILEHRTALSNASELLIPLEFGYGLVLMILWRTLHSSYVLR